MALTLRNVKGSELTWTELDNNFTTLDTKIDNNMLSNSAVLVNFSELDGKVLYNGAEIGGTSSGSTSGTVASDFKLFFYGGF